MDVENAWRERLRLLAKHEVGLKGKQALHVARCEAGGTDAEESERGRGVEIKPLKSLASIVTC